MRAETTPLRKECKEFVNAYHSYIKWADRPSRKLYWALFEKGKMVGVFGLASAFAKPKAVMTFMQKHNLLFNEVGNNIVYCLANYQQENVGSAFLSLIRKDAICWWHQRYGDVLKAMQTFILPPRTGAMYKADNWEQLGVTVGQTMQTRTLYGSERDKYPNAEVRKFKSGEVKYVLREFATTAQKIIFMRLHKTKEINKLLKLL